MLNLNATWPPPRYGEADFSALLPQESGNVRRAKYFDAAYDLIRAELLPKAPMRVGVALAYSFPSKRSGGANTTIGECHYLTEAPKSDGLASLKAPSHSHLITIHPMVWTRGDVEVLAVLAHEMVHAALGKGVGHKGPFAKECARIGLEGKPTATVPGDAFKQWVDKARARLPKFPGGADIRLGGKVKQPTRLRKWQCQGCEKPVIARVASDDFQAVCLECDTEFAMADKPE